MVYLGINVTMAVEEHRVGERAFQKSKIVRRTTALLDVYQVVPRLVTT